MNVDIETKAGQNLQGLLVTVADSQREVYGKKWTMGMMESTMFK